ncbi:type II toxin-antitoxin system HipA family toxin [Microbacterium sp. 3H14]|uniref:HipA domain-containing protein n=1 Tax=unclassified Microbacterium TaxID=2609290 RepID=UPI00106BE4EF|nr:HipA domain-containing protein [Microbacterium sp. 3H14]TFB17293.1 type II toxin-antitoxin system HipA family toxin [Microbacterium sp. 3H14]
MTVAPSSARVELVAYVDGQRTGVFSQNAHGGITFTYDDDLSPVATPLSISMPLVAGAEYGNRVARPFLQGLLSDNPATLEAIAAAHHTSPRNPMGLLRHVGRDTAGALQLLPPGEASDDAAARTGDVHFVDDLGELVASVVDSDGDRSERYDEFRWSLAGAQPKLALYRSDDGRWGVPRDSTPTTHILKPAAPGGRHDVNEFLTMRAGRVLGLRVADHGLMITDRGDFVFVAKRYDRVHVGDRLHRLHQEDFAQALSVDPAFKYQSDGGPGLEKFAQVLRAFAPSEGRRASHELFEALVFTCAAANTDAHAKNYSVIHAGAQMRLAPLYDLGSNALYRGDQPMPSAVSIGGERVMGRIGMTHWLKAAKTLGVDAQTARDAVERIRGGVAAAFSAARDDLLADDDGLAYADRLVEAVGERAQRHGW